MPTSGFRSGVRVIVAGDRGTGKSSLIVTAASESFPENVPPVLPPTRLPADFFPDFVPVTIIDTSSSLESRFERNEELRRADVVVLTYACDQLATHTRIRTYWLPELRQLEVKVPVVVVGCKLDLRDRGGYDTYYGTVQGNCNLYRMVCSYPDSDRQTLEPKCISALRRIFILYDRDMDGALNDEELNKFQVTCFNAPLQPAEIVGVKRVVREKLPDGINQLGLTLRGFLYLHSLFIEKGCLETTWAVLRKFGYNDDLKLRDDFLPVPSKRYPDQTTELTSEAVEFLGGIFRLLDTDNDGALQPAEINELFSTAPESGNPASALRDTRRTIDRKKHKTERSVFQCFVVGPKIAGKSSLLNSLLGRPFSASYLTSTTSKRFAVNVVNQVGNNRRTLLLREIPEDGFDKFLSNKEFPAPCDVAVFIYYSSDEYSWKRSQELLVDVVRHGEDSGYGVTYLLISAKSDLNPYPIAIQDSMRFCLKLGIEAPIPVSVKLNNLNNIFNRIVDAAVHPHLNIPETELGRRRKQHPQLVSRSVMCMSVGAAAAAAAAFGLAIGRVYTVRRNTSS